MEQAQNPLMAKIKLPGRVFQLPSRGALYKNNEVQAIDGEIHVHALSGLAEINLKNPDLLFNGKALDEVFAECIPEIKNAADLCGRDIDAIMYFLRLVTYGPEYVIEVKHTCENSKNHSYIVNLEELVSKMKQLDPTTIEQNFSVVVPSGQLVKVHPVKFNHMVKLFQSNVNKTEFSVEDVKRNLIFNLTSVIESVDDITDKKQIEEWVRAVSSPFHNKITEAIEKTNDWGPPQTTKIVCKDCGEEMNVELPINPINFFTE